MSKKHEEYPVFSEIKLDQLPENAMVRELPDRNNVKANVYSIASFVLAILSIFPCLIILSAPVSAVGFILAIVALCCKTTKKGFAISGLIINLLTLAVSILFMCLSTTIATGLYTTAHEFIQSLFYAS